MSYIFIYIFIPDNIYFPNYSIFLVLMNVHCCWSTKTGLSGSSNPQENIALDFVPASPGCLVCHTHMVHEMGGRLPYSCYFMGFSFQDLIKFTQFFCFFCSYWAFPLSSFLISRSLQPYKSIDLVLVLRNSYFILSNILVFHMNDNFFTAVHFFFV